MVQYNVGEIFNDRSGVVSRHSDSLEPELLGRVLDLLPQSVMVTDGDLESPGPRIVYVNQSFTLLTGYTAEEVLGKSPRILQGCGTDPAVLKRLKTCLLRSERFEGRTLNYRKDGTPFINAWTVEPVLDAHGQVTHFLSTLREAVAHKPTDVLPQIGQDVADVLPDAVILVDREGRIRRGNRAFSTFLGAPWERWSGQVLAGILFSDTALHRTSQSALRDPLVTVQLPGRVGWYQVRNIPLAGGDAGWVHIVTDVTERKLQALALQHRVGERDGLLQVAVLSAEDRLTYANVAFQQAMDISPEEVGSCVFGLDDLGISPPEVLAEMLGCLRSAGRWQGQYTAPDRGDGPRVMETTAMPMHDSYGRSMGIVLFARDVTQARRMESIAATAHLTTNIGSIFAGILHEVGNPLVSLRLGFELLQKHWQQFTPARLEGHLTGLDQELTRIEQLLQSLRGYSGFERLSLGPVDLMRELPRVARVLRPDLERRGICLVMALPERATCMAEPRALHQILLSLINHAADQMEGLEAACIVVQVWSTEQRVCIEVVDNGPSLSTARKTRVFQPVFDVPQKGLGLAVVQRLVAQLGGTVEVLSGSGRGSSYRVELDIA